MKYITILEVENNECPNVGTITTDENINDKFKEAIESHFYAELISFSFDGEVEKLDDCINSYPIDVLVKLDVDGDECEYRVELSQTWLY